MNTLHHPLNNKIIQACFLLCHLHSIVYGLRWTSSGVPVPFKTIHLSSSSRSLDIDMWYETQITIVRDVQFWNQSLTIHCFIKGYDNSSEFIYSFCKKDDQCIQFKEKTKTMEFKNFNVWGKVETNVLGRIGFQIVIYIPNKYVDTSGVYFCKVENNKVVLQSNYVEIRDTFFWERKIFTKIESSYKSNIERVGIDDIPKIFNCSDGNSELNSLLPKWTKSQLSIRMAWSVCPVLKDYNKLTSFDTMSPEKCLSFTENKCNNKINEQICPRGLSKMSGWKYHITDRGDLIVTGLPQENTNTGSTYALMCYTKDSEGDLQSVSFFLNKKNDVNIESGIAIDSSPSSVLQKLQAISPRIQEFIIYARQESSDRILEPISIYAFYKSHSETSFQWKFNGVKLNSNNFMTISRYMVTFEKGISSDQTGKYVLEVTDKTDKLLMELNVKVLGFPVLVDDRCIPSLVYIWRGGNANFSCTYKNNPTTLKILINSQEIQLNDTLKTSQDQLKSSYPYLSELFFNVSSTMVLNSELVSLDYNVFNLRRTEGNAQYQDHTVTFLASNDYGMSIKTASIYVLPNIKSIVDYFPKKDNCTTSCRSSDEHKFKCDVKLMEYANKELLVEHFWTINGQTIEDTTSNPSNPINPSNIYSPYFRVDPKNKELTLLPIQFTNARDKYFKEDLKDNYIECNINMRTLSKEESDFTYHSYLDQELGDLMKAKVTLDFAPLKTASLYWIMGLIIGIVLVILVVSFIVFYNKKKVPKDNRLNLKYDRAKTSAEDA